MLRMPQNTVSNRLGLTLPESLSCYEQALSPIVLHRANAFRPTTHQGKDRPENGTSPSIGYFQEISSAALWVGKMPVFTEIESNSRIPACLEIIAAGIYAYYGVVIPHLAVGNDFPVNPQGAWIDTFRDENVHYAPHILSRWLGRFTPYGESNNPAAIKSRWETQHRTDCEMLIYDQLIIERGLGKILAIAQWLNDSDVIGGSGGNIGYEFQTDLKGKLYVRTCKIDTGEAFSGFAQSSLSGITFSLRIDRNDTTGVMLSTLPNTTQREFLLTLYQIMQTPDEVLTQFFMREGAECLQENNVVVRNTIGSIDQAITTLKARRQKLKEYYGAAIQEIVTQYQREQQALIPQNPNPMNTIADDNIRFMRDQVLATYDSVEIQQALHFYVEGEGVSAYGRQDRLPLTHIIREFLREESNRVLLLLGESGSGKSINTQKLLYELWKAYSQNPRSQTSIPLLIELKRFTEHTVAQCVERTLQEDYHFIPERITYHKHNSSFVLIFDGYDEIGGQPELNLYNANHLSEWRYAKVIITCRSTDKAANNLLLFSPSLNHVAGLCTKYLAPFSFAQIQSYVDKQPETINAQFQVLLQTHPNLIQLIENPFILVLVIQVLPILLGIKAGEITCYKLYSAFMQQWFSKQETRLTTFLGGLATVNIQATFRMFAEGLAFNMLVSKTNTVQKSDVPDSPWQRFFAPTSGDIFHARLACPLKIQGDEFAFIHKSFIEYFAANHLWAALENLASDVIEIWSHCVFSKELAVLNFLTECLNDSPRKTILETRLLEIVLMSRNNPRIATAASSAITLLNRVGFNFYHHVPNQDFTDIHIPYADLPEIRLMGINGSRMDATDVNFHNAVLVGAKLCQAKLIGARFLAGEAYVFTKYFVETMVLHPFRTGIAVYGDGKDIVIVRIADGFIERRLTGHRGVVTSLAFGPNGVLASGSRDKTIRIWDITRERAHLKTLEGHAGRVTSIAFGPNGIFASASHDKTIRLWDMSQEYAHFKTLEGHEWTVTSVTFCSNNVVASGSADKTIRFWDITREAPHFKTLVGHTEEVTCVVFCFNKVLASGSRDKTIRIWDITRESPHLKTFEGHAGPVTSLAFCSTKNTLASGGEDKTICLWDITREDAYLKRFEGHTEQVTSLSFDLNASLASGGADKTIRFWDITLENASLKAIEGHTGQITSVAFGPNGVLATGDADKTIHLWDITRENAYLKALKGHLGAITSLVFSPNGVLASGSADSTIRIWDITREKAYRTTLRGSGYSKEITSLAFYSNDVLAVICGGSLFFWDIDREREKDFYRSFQCGSDAITSLSFRSHGASNDIQLDVHIAISGGSTIDLWNGYSRIKHFKEHQKIVTSLAFGPNGVLASGSKDNTIRIWNIKTRENETIKTLEGHTNWITSLVFSSDKNWLISSSDNEILIWNTRNWNAPPYSFPFGATHLCIQGHFLSFSRGKAIYAIDLADFPHSYRWIMAGATSLWLQGCNVTGARVLLPTQQLLEKEKSVGKPQIEQMSATSLGRNRNRFLNSEAQLGSDRAQLGDEDRKSWCVIG